MEWRRASVIYAGGGQVRVRIDGDTEILSRVRVHGRARVQVGEEGRGRAVGQAGCGKTKVHIFIKSEIKGGIIHGTRLVTFRWPKKRGPSARVSPLVR